MSQEWYYTTNKQQMGPVSWKELRELADIGILKPHDLIWTEGMDEWVKAINQQGLFAESDDEAVTTSGKKTSYSQPKPPPGRRTKKEAEEEEDEEEDEREAKKRNRKREEERAKMGVGIKVGLILAGVLFLLLLGGGCIVGIIAVTVGGFGGGGPAVPKGPVHEQYTIRNLRFTPAGADHRNGDIRTFTFTQGRRVVITVNNQGLQFPNTDVDLYIHRGNDPNPLVGDINVPQVNRNCRVEFVVPATGQYRVRVVNIGPGNVNQCDVRVDEN